ncbi:MAG TPA: methyl-accepting chemotaxis protein [Spirochaetota bacterium]|nr:methyl-accepting chemotaxis protein [Spirochaetota bacterium]HPJ34858.1 methyl-accepting chemotaxis protein [Spirochaetota bacterium]
MDYHYSAKEYLEIRGLFRALILTTIMVFIAAFFQKLAGVPFITIATTSVPFIMVIALIYWAFRRKKVRKSVGAIVWVAGFFLTTFPILAKYNYAVNIDWLYATQGIHIYGLSMLSLIILQFFYNKKLYAFFIFWVFLNWALFLYAASAHGVEMPFLAFVDGKPHIGIVLLRQLYFIITMICIAYASFSNIPELERFDLRTSTQRQIIEEQSEKQQNLANEIKNNISVLFSELDEQNNVINDINERMQNQASTFEEISATLEELQSSSESISNSAENQKESSSLLNRKIDEFRNLKKDIKARYDETLGEIESVVDKTSLGKEKIDRVVKTMDEMKEHSSRIAQTITIIIDIADQINLLSLNASIEAARAGEHGRGFAVVADEIGKLATQTSDSTKEIENLLSQNSKTTSNGVKVIDEASDLIVGMIDNIAQNADRIRELQEFTIKEESFLEEINRQMDENLELSKNIGTSTNEQKIATESTSVSIEHVNEMMTQMADGVNNVAESFSKIAENAKKLLQLSGVKKDNEAE